MRWWIWVLLGIAALGILAKIGLSVMPASLTIPDDDDLEALSRMITSENGADKRIVRIAVAWAAKNEAARRGISVAQLVMPTGVPGDQGSPGHGYASTARAASAEDEGIAYDVLSGKEADPTGGAIQFDAPRTQRVLHNRNPSKYKTPEEVAANRIREGKELVTIPGIDPDYMRWWRYV